MTSPPSSRSRGRPTANAEQDVRAGLLDAAIALYARQGIAATSMAQVAKAAGVTPAMVHYYFSNRDRLLDALVDERLAPNIAQVWAAIDDAPDDARAQLREVIARLTARVAELQWLPTLWIGEVLNDSGLLRERMLARLPLSQLQKLAAALIAAQARGELHPDIAPRLMPVSVLGLVMLPFVVLRLLATVPGFPTPDPELIARHATALLLHGLSTPREDS